MRRSNFIVGIGLSVVAHGVLLFTVVRAKHSTPPASIRPVAAPVQIASLDPDRIPLDPMPMEPPPLPPREPASAEVVKPQKTLPSEPLPLEELITSRPPEHEPRREVEMPPVDPRPTSDTSRRISEGDDDGVPPLRVHWTDAGELISVARALGMRLAAVDATGSIIAEIDLSDTPGLKKWQGLPYGYSNRVRMLSPSIFAQRFGDADHREIRDIWIFVPSDRDRSMIRTQRDAVMRAGARSQDILYMDARFVRAANGSYRLDITNVRRKAPGTNRSS